MKAFTWQFFFDEEKKKFKIPDNNGRLENQIQKIIGQTISEIVTKYPEYFA